MEDGRRTFKLRIAMDGIPVGEGFVDFFPVHGEAFAAIRDMNADFRGEDSEHVYAVLEATLEEAYARSFGRLGGEIRREYNGHDYLMEVTLAEV